MMNNPTDADLKSFIDLVFDKLALRAGPIVRVELNAGRSFAIDNLDAIREAYSEWKQQTNPDKQASG